MSTHRHLNRIAVFLMLAAVIFASVFCFFSGKLGVKASSDTLGYEEYFDEDAVMTVDIEADDDAWQAFLDNGQAEEYIRCNVVINGERIDNVGIRTKGNSSLQQVASSDSDRFSLKLEFDHYIDNQTFHGLDKLVLNNMYADATYMKEFMGYEIFEKLGVDVPLHSYAQIAVNGENSGLYMAVEAMEESYAYRVYGSDYGKLYRPESTDMDAMGRGSADNRQMGFGNNQSGESQSGDSHTGDTRNSGGGRDGNMPAFPGTDAPGNPGNDTMDELPTIPEGFDQYSANYFLYNMGGNLKDRDMNAVGMFGGNMAGGTDLVYNDDDISSYSAIYNSSVFDISDSDFERVITALKNLNNGTELEKYIDVDATLRYFAAQTFIINFDSYYGTLQHNYYLYEKNGQLTMLPWDLNLAFGGFGTTDAGSAINYPVDTPLSGVEMEDRPMLSKLLEVPEYKELYHQYLAELVDDYFDNGEYSAKIAATDALISSYVQEDATAFFTYDEYEAAVPELNTFGMLRSQSVEGQLDGTIPSTQEAQAADNSSLVDTGDLNLSDLGSQGGNGGWGKGTAGGNFGAGNNNRFSDAKGWPGVENESSSGDGTSSEDALTPSADLKKADVLGLGAIGGITVAGFLFVLLKQRRKYHL